MRKRPSARWNTEPSTETTSSPSRTISRTVFPSASWLLKPLPDNVRGMVAALVGCVAGAILVEETRALMEAAGFSKIILTPRSDYVRNMQNWNDPLYRQIAEALPEGRELSEYITSLSIEAWK